MREETIRKKLKQVNHDLGFVNTLLEEKKIVKKHKDRLEKYSIQRKKLNVGREEMKQ